MNNRKYLFSFIYILFFSITIFSQSAALVLTHFDIKDEAVLKETQDQVVKQLVKELSRQNLEYWDESYVASSIRNKELTSLDLMRPGVALKLGVEAEVPVVITVQAMEKESFLEIIVSAWDVQGEKKITEDRKVSRSSVTRYIMINSSISYVIDKLTGEYGIESITEDPMVKKITFISNQEGLEVYMPDGEFLGEIVHSILNVTDREFEIGTQLLITKKLEGYREAEQLITLSSEKSAVPLGDLKKAQTLALEMNWTYPQLMGAGSGIRYYPVADWMFVSFDSYFNVQKDFSSPFGGEMTHSDFRFLVGLYIGMGPESIFRVNASLGAGIIFSNPLDRAGQYIDFYVNPINISLELNFENWSFYLRPELKISLGIGDNSLLDGGIFLSEFNVPVITLGVLRKW